MSKEKGMIVYDGPSKIDGRPIVGVVIHHSDNRKTGDMAQLYILVKGVAPFEAGLQGKDESVCGSCPMRHSLGGACYVNLLHGPRMVWGAYKRGLYSKNLTLKSQKSFRRQPLRLGAYGDPAALPYGVVSKLCRMFAGHTGYSHQWRTCDQRFKDLVMASCETTKDREAAHAKGWRTFRAVSNYSEMEAGERVCANDSHDTQCADCMACHGKGGRADIVIEVHGSRAKRYSSLVEMIGAG